MRINIYADNHLLYIWKPHGIPTTFGKEKSLLDYLEEGNFISPCIDIFGKEKEFWLLNRLDNETAGIVFFAKSLETYNLYKQLQSEHKVHKTYIADVEGNFLHGTYTIDYPIAHHAYAHDRMVVITPQTKPWITRGKEHAVTTEIKKLYYDPENNLSTLQITITKGIRHQIRAHLASIGCPIIGDSLYGNKKNADTLHLWSVGIEI